MSHITVPLSGRPGEEATLRNESSLNEAVLKELLGVRYGRRSCCASSELDMLLFCLRPKQGVGELLVRTTRVLLAQRLVKLCRQVLGRSASIGLSGQPSGKTPGRHRILVTVSPQRPEHYSEKSLETRLRRGFATRTPPCCATAFLRALYWIGGHLSVSRSGFHVELVIPPAIGTDTVDYLLEQAGLNLKSTIRNNRTVYYAKSGQAVCETIGRLGAISSVLLLQDVIITKQIKNDVNRLVNAELGNLERIGASSAADIEAVRILRSEGILDRMPKTLRQVAEFRCKYPSLSMKELGLKLFPPLSKAAVYRRLSRLRQEAGRERTTT